MRTTAASILSMHGNHFNHFSKRFCNTFGIRLTRIINRPVNHVSNLRIGVG